MAANDNEVIKDGCEDEVFYSPQSSADNMTETNIMTSKERSCVNSDDAAECIKAEQNNQFPVVRPSEADVQVEILQTKLAESNKKYMHMSRANKALHGVIEEYERTMNQIISSRPDVDSLQAIKTEKQKAQLELQSSHIAFHNLLQRYDELKQSSAEAKSLEASLRQRNAEIQSEYIILERRFDSLKRQAEAKLEEANKEISELREGFELEVSIMKTKLHKADLQISSLEATIKTKADENAELMKICDELIGKMDRKF